jgi:proline iminopeptidase
MHSGKNSKRPSPPDRATAIRSAVVEEGFATADDGARLWFAVEGSGPPLVLCHGGPGLWDYLHPLAGLLTGSARVIRWEQRGCGRSETRGPYSVERFTADLEHLRAHLGYDRWIVGGHSWGATLALHDALDHPARVAGLVYVSGVGIGRAWNAAYHEEADRRLSDMQRRRRDELGALERTPAEEHEYRTLCWVPDYADPSDAVELAATEAASPFPVNYECNRVLNAETKTWSEDDLIARCRRLDAPALIVHGAADPRPAWAVDSLAAALPNADVQIIPRSGHLPWIETPTEVTSAITGFIEGVGARCQ